MFVLHSWTRSQRRYVCRMSAGDVQIFDERIQYIWPFMPDVFNRKLRASTELTDYKYTQLRQILLYTGKLLLFDITSWAAAQPPSFEWSGFLPSSAPPPFSLSSSSPFPTPVLPLFPFHLPPFPIPSTLLRSRPLSGFYSLASASATGSTWRGVMPCCSSWMSVTAVTSQLSWLTSKLLCKQCSNLFLNNNNYHIVSIFDRNSGLWLPKTGTALNGNWSVLCCVLCFLVKSFLPVVSCSVSLNPRFHFRFKSIHMFLPLFTYL